MERTGIEGDYRLPCQLTTLIRQTSNSPTLRPEEQQRSCCPDVDRNSYGCGTNLSSRRDEWFAALLSVVKSLLRAEAVCRPDVRGRSGQRDGHELGDGGLDE